MPSNEILIGFLTILIIAVGLIALYAFGAFNSSTPTPTPTPTPNALKANGPQPVIGLNSASPDTIIPPVSVLQSPSDLHPFVDLADAIEPSILPEAKKDYNNIIMTFFKVINAQSVQLDNNSGEIYIPAIQAEMTPLLTKLVSKYTPEVAGKLVKFLLLKQITSLLDNYYSGPPINLTVPLPPPETLAAMGPNAGFANAILPMIFTYTSKTKTKVVNASTIAPFKYLVYNIPNSIRAEVVALYDDMIDRYMQAINEMVLPLTEVNMETIKKIDMQLVIAKYSPMYQQDLLKISDLFGKNTSKIVNKIFSQNIGPLLVNFYTGPGITITAPIAFDNNPQIFTLNYPNKIFRMTPGCPPGKQITLVDGVKKCRRPQPGFGSYFSSYKKAVTTSATSLYGTTSAFSLPIRTTTAAPSTVVTSAAVTSPVVTSPTVKSSVVTSPVVTSPATTSPAISSSVSTISSPSSSSVSSTPILVKK